MPYFIQLHFSSITVLHIVVFGIEPTQAEIFISMKDFN